jgi:hypothetical protein
VADIFAWHAPIDTRRPVVAGSAKLFNLVVSDSARRLWHFLVPGIVGQKIAMYQLVTVDGVWIDGEQGWLLLATGIVARKETDSAQHGGRAVCDKEQVEVLRGWLDQLNGHPRDPELQKELARTLVKVVEQVSTERMGNLLERAASEDSLRFLRATLVKALKSRFWEAWERRDMVAAERALRAFRANREHAQSWVTNRSREVESYRLLLATEDLWEKQRLAKQLPFLTESERTGIATAIWMRERGQLETLVREQDVDGAVELYWRLRAVQTLNADLDAYGIQLALVLECRGEKDLPRDPQRASASLEESVALYAGLSRRGPKERRREAFLLEGLGEAYERLERTEWAILCYERMRLEASRPKEIDDIAERLAGLYRRLGLNDLAAEVASEAPDNRGTTAEVEKRSLNRAAHKRWQEFLDRARADTALARMGMAETVDDLLARERFLQASEYESL